jgi:hypothetical protein
MQKVPKIVQERLRRATLRAVETHPDADMLTAFTEQSLGESERARVMEHLARCGDCREVVSLALPSTEAVTLPSSAGGARDAWLSWPVLRWGVVAAGVVLVTSIGILQYTQRTQQNAALVSSTARVEEKAITARQTLQPSPQTPATQALVSQTSEIAKKTPMQEQYRSRSAAAADQPSPSPNAIFPVPQPMSHAGSEGGVGGRGFRSGSIGSAPVQAPGAYQVQPQSDALALALPAREPASAAPQNQTAPNPPAAATQQVVVSGAAQTVEVETARQDQVQGQLAKNQTELPAQKQPLNNLDVVKAKDSVPPQAQSSVVFAPTVATPRISLQESSTSSPRWTINSGGVLQRSFDAGATWEDVNVSATPLSASALMNIRGEQKEQAKKIRQKEQANPAVVFRAVAANGAEVWAGGAGAMLYHSLDSGDHWTQILPSEANASLAGDVIGVEFSGTQQGRVVTSSGEIWLTADGGQTWHKQQ